MIPNNYFIPGLHDEKNDDMNDSNSKRQLLVLAIDAKQVAFIARGVVMASAGVKKLCGKQEL